MSQFYSNEENVILPKGTILHHYMTKNNKNRKYRWYYLECQNYDCVFSSNLKIFKTNFDITLHNFYCARICNKKTGKYVKDGIYDSENYKWDIRRTDLDIKNNITYKFPLYTFENEIRNGYDPLRHQYLFDEDGIHCIEYEIILDNELVEELIIDKNILDNYAHYKYEVCLGSYDD
jgi:hypothetical protein